MSYDGGGIQSITAGSGIDISGTPQNPIIAAAVPIVYQGTYYKSASQNLINGNTNVTFDQTASWNNPNGYITHVSGSKDFTVVQTGLYQLEFNYAVNANGATWSGSQTKQALILVKRGTTEGIIQNSAAIQSSISYAQLSNATYYLQTGDEVSCQIFCNFAVATPNIIGLTNSFDLNTWFSWRFISA